MLANLEAANLSPFFFNNFAAPLSENIFEGRPHIAMKRFKLPRKVVVSV